jgi:hypothetical protein
MVIPMMGSGINKPFDELISNGLSVRFLGDALNVRQAPNFKHQITNKFPCLPDLPPFIDKKMGAKMFK